MTTTTTIYRAGQLVHVRDVNGNTFTATYRQPSRNRFPHDRTGIEIEIRGERTRVELANIKPA